MKKSGKIIYLLFIVLFSCEYNLEKENYREIAPPEDYHRFDLNLTPEGDTLYLFKDVQLQYNINTFGLDIINAELTLQEHTWNLTYSPSGTITINTEQFTPGIDTLELKLYSNSGTGSLADNLDSEGYFIEQQWIVVIDHRSAPVLVPTKTISDNGMLKFTWPKCEQYNFVAYEIEAMNSSRIIKDTIYDSNQNFYVDSLFIGGDYYIRVSCRVKNGFTWGESLRFEEPVPELYFEELGYDRIRITWDMSPYNAQYLISWENNNRYYNSAEDTSLIIPQPGFGTNTRFYIYIKSEHDHEIWSTSDNYYLNRYKDYHLGEQIKGHYNSKFAYNPLTEIVYSNNSNNLNALNINDYSVLNSTDINGFVNQFWLSCPTNSSKIAAIQVDKIYVFDDNTFQNPVVFSYSVENSYYIIGHFIVTDNNFVAYTTTNTSLSGVGVYNLFNVETRKKVLSINIENYATRSNWANVTTSQDAKYMCTTSPYGVMLYNIENGIANELYSDERSYRSCYFNPYNPEELFLSMKNKTEIEIRNPSNFELIKTLATPSIVVIQNIDPATKHMLITDYQHFYIMDIENEELLLKIPGEEINWLFNNKIFTNTGYALDVSADL